MDKNLLKKILRFYDQEQAFLATGTFGEGLWPVNPELGQFMYWLIRFQNLQRGIEVGAGVGYSTAWLASAFRESRGTLVSFEYFPPKVKLWEQQMSRLFGLQYDQIVQIVPSDISKGIRHLGSQKIDFVFFDQRKGDYLEHLKLLIPTLKKGAFICADNVLSHASACAEYLEFVRNDQRFESFCLEIGDGLEVSRYR